MIRAVRSQSDNLNASRYIKAFEVGKTYNTAKYEVHVKLKSKRSGPVIRPNQLKLPYVVKADVKFAVICPSDSRHAKQARDAGAVLVGEEEIFQAVKDGKINFDRLLAHPISMPKLAKEGLPRILGPRGLMPNAKNGTISTDPAGLLKQLVGGALYRERLGVVRMAIGKMSFTPEMLRDNLRTFLHRIKEDASKLPEQESKEINEVVLSSTRSPGFSLNGLFRTANSLPTSVLSVS
jgi:large subunit ribosomal protein L1